MGPAHPYVVSEALGQSQAHRLIFGVRRCGRSRSANLKYAPHAPPAQGSRVHHRPSGTYVTRSYLADSSGTSHDDAKPDSKSCPDVMMSANSELKIQAMLSASSEGTVPGTHQLQYELLTTLCELPLQHWVVLVPSPQTVPLPLLQHDLRRCRKAESKSCPVPSAEGRARKSIIRQPRGTAGHLDTYQALTLGARPAWSNAASSVAFQSTVKVYRLASLREKLVESSESA